MDGIWMQLDFLLRLAVASVCGAFIGYERKNRLKEAGIRTHVIVALASCLMMIISKYGFNDVLQLEGVGLDPSRVAAGIVTGVGFVGAGTIFIRKQAVSGLTTAAGVWATVGVGMAIGAGLYFIGIASMGMIIVLQFLLHRNLNWLKIPVAELIAIRMDDDGEVISYVQNEFLKHGIQVINVKAEKISGGEIDVEFYVKLPEAFNTADLLNILKDNKKVKSIEI